MEMVKISGSFPNVNRNSGGNPKWYLLRTPEEPGAGYFLLQDCSNMRTGGIYSQRYPGGGVRVNKDAIPFELLPFELLFIWPIVRLNYTARDVPREFSWNEQYSSNEFI